MKPADVTTRPWYSAFRDDPVAPVLDRPEIGRPEVFSSPPALPPRPPRKRLHRLREIWAACLAGIAMRLPLRVSGAVATGMLIAGAVLTGGYFLYINVMFRIHNATGNTAYEQGRWQDALDEYGQMVDLCPRNTDGYMLRGMTYWKLHQYSPAAADETSILDLIRDRSKQWDCLRAIAYQSRGYDYDAIGMHTRAISDFDRAISCDPTVYDRPDDTANAHDGTADSYKGRLWAFFRSGRYGAALLDCNRLIARNPRYADNYAVRGKIERAAGDTKAAVADFEQAIQRDPHDLLGYEALMDMQEHTHQAAAALATAQASLRANPGSAVARGNLGWCLYNVGNVNDALSTDQAALAQDKSLPWVNDNAGLIYAEEGNWPLAQAAYNQALKQAGAEGARLALPDVEAALVQHPHSQTLRQARALLQQGAG